MSLFYILYTAILVSLRKFRNSFYNFELKLILVSVGYFKMYRTRVVLVDELQVIKTELREIKTELREMKEILAKNEVVTQKRN